jgi:hypothetical protein
MSQITRAVLDEAVKASANSDAPMSDTSITALANAAGADPNDEIKKHGQMRREWQDACANASGALGGPIIGRGL